MMKIAACSGVFGKAIAVDALYNGLVNDKGCRNTNKPGDLKVKVQVQVQVQVKVKVQVQVKVKVKVNVKVKVKVQHLSK